MIDHVLGKPSSKSRRLQVLAVLAFWSAYLLRGDKNGPPGTRAISRLLSKKLTAWQMVVLTMIYLYAARNFSTLVGLSSPDPLANMYDPTYFRATWVLTALDAGFWTAMKIRTAWMRNLASVLFSGFYLFATEKADEKVRKVRGNLTVEHLRVSWNKGTTPYLGALQRLLRPRLTRWPPRRLRIPRPASSDYQGEPIMGWLYYDGSLEQLRASRVNRVVLDLPGGGFVAMDPRCNDDRLFSWAVQTGLPILSLDYKKAPEYPFPYALNECYDAYVSIVKTRGRCLGLAAEEPVRVVVSGDSAGGNLAAAMALMVAQSASEILTAKDEYFLDPLKKQQRLPLPEALILTYPALDMNIGNWMSDEQMALIQDRRQRATNKNVFRRKANQYSELTGTPHESDDEDLAMTSLSKKETSEPEDTDSAGDGAEEALTPRPAFSRTNMSSYVKTALAVPQTPKEKETEEENIASYHPQMLSTRLATSSMISYFNDRVLTAEMMRAMIILYIGPHHRPDFSKEYLLSPILAPDLLLAHFPKTYFLTGERDPLVDDTVIFAGRLRRVKAAFYASGGRRLEYRDTDASAEGFDDRDVAEVVLIPGVSHGFLQFPTIYPPAWKWINRSAAWIQDAFDNAEEKREQMTERARARSRTRKDRSHIHEFTPRAKKAAADKTLKIDVDMDTNNGRVDGPVRPSTARTESSGDEDGPLMMMRMTKVKGKVMDVPAKSNRTNSEMSNGANNDGTNTEAESAVPPSTQQTATEKTAKANKKKQARQRALEDKDLVKLASSDDLLGRRMKGIVGGLNGVTEE